MFLYDIILPLPLEVLFTYKSNEEINIGTRVIVPVKNRIYTGLIANKTCNLPQNIDVKIKEIKEILDKDKPFFAKEYIDLIYKLSAEYCCSNGAILDSIMPLNLLKIPYEISADSSIRKKLQKTYVPSEKTSIKISKDISHAISNGNFKHLLFDKTGISKYDIFLSLITEIISMGKQVKIITSDIHSALKFFKFVKRMLNVEVEVYHSRRGLSVRKKIIGLLRNGAIDILIGTKSALLLPSHDLGLIIIEDEHDELYKQEESPHIQYIRAAEIYSEIFKIPLLLSSSMPSVESYYKAMKGYYFIHKIEKNISKVDINIIDMKKAEKISNTLTVFTYEKIYNAINHHKKVLILINKKGFSRYLVCSNCGAVLQCDRCSVALTYYKIKNYCRCNYCGKIRTSLICNKCGSDNFIDYGEGLEQIYENIKKLFDCKVLKFDADIINEKGEEQKLLEIIEGGYFDILVSTNAVFRRFDNLNIFSILLPSFENLTNFSDFRIYERVMRQLYILLGNVDNFSNAFEIYIQTYATENILFEFINRNIEDFYNYELNKRQNYLYPPYAYLARFILSSKNYDILPVYSRQLIEAVYNMKELIILGPTNTIISKIRDHFRYHFIIKSTMKEPFYEACRKIRNRFFELKNSHIKLNLDIDPYFFI